jgi:lipid II:glycine glycyltransferase (peptidoglycan interpeptide bridge formation enzyme)
MIQVVTVSKNTQEKYTAYVNQHPQSRFGHDLAWAQVLRETYHVKAEHLIALDGDRVVGACPLFLCQPIFGGAHYQTSLFPSYFGPLYDSEEVLDKILDKITAKASTLQYAEILSPVALPVDQRLPFFEQLDYTYRLPLNDTAEHLFGNFRRNYRRILKDPKLHDALELVVDSDGSLVRDFYRLYADLYARKHGFIPHVEKLFRSIHAHYPNGAARTYLARHNGKYIGGIFTFWVHDEIYCGWSAQDLGTEYNPMHFLIWSIIQDGVEQKYRWFNHGESPRENENLKLFKQGWNMEASDTYRYFVPGQLTTPLVRLYDRFSWTKKIISHLPSPLTRTFISPLIRFVL